MAWQQFQSGQQVTAPTIAAQTIRTNLLSFSNNIVIDGFSIQSIYDRLNEVGPSTYWFNTLFVSKDGDDATASVNGLPQASVITALSQATAGQTVYILPGSYTLTGGLEVPTGVSMRGLSLETVKLLQSDTLDPTIGLTLYNNTRVEDLSLTVTGTSNTYGVVLATGSSITSKLRSTVINTFGSTTGNVQGIYCPYTSSTGPSSADLARGITVNVTSQSANKTRGVYLDANNLVALRDSNVYCTGSGLDVMGAETVSAGAALTIKACSVSAYSSAGGASVFDVGRTQPSSLLIGYSDLLSNNCNGTSFSTAQKGVTEEYGIIGNLSANTSQNVVPSFVPLVSLPASTVFRTVPQNTIIVLGIMTFTGTLLVGESIQFDLQQNASPVYSLFMTGSNATIIKENVSVNLLANDVIHATVTTVGNPGNGAWSASLTQY